MDRKHRQTGLTLTEMAVVVAVIALLAGLALPTARVVIESFESGESTMSMINSALASARALAAKEGHYVGVRFQIEYDPSRPDPLTAPQYMIFVIHDSSMMASAFRALEGSKPVKLPDSVLVMDLAVRTNHGVTANDAEDVSEEPLQVGHLDDGVTANLGPDSENIHVTDTCAFSIVFSPSGKVVRHEVRVRNRDDVYRPDNTGTKISTDDVFNSPINIGSPSIDVGMFVQDDYAERGLGAELSRYGFVVCDKLMFRNLDALGRFDYLSSLEFECLNPHTGTIILRK
ncbi:MAG: pilus assembly FimT family protein [Planctomycetota bacterium]|jgi:prepilin-type N-terminal cleavage/methylation domain-containing protein